MLAILKDTFGFKAMAFIHVLSAIIAFGPLFIYPQLRKANETKAIAKSHMQMTFPALIVLWFVGMGMAGMSKFPGAEELTYQMSQFWLAASFVIWAGLVAVSWFLIRPAIADDSEAATKKLAAGTGITHLGLVICLFLMFWKPGL